MGILGGKRHEDTKQTQQFQTRETESKCDCGAKAVTACVVCQVPLCNSHVHYMHWSSSQPKCFWHKG